MPAPSNSEQSCRRERVEHAATTKDNEFVLAVIDIRQLLINVFLDDCHGVETLAVDIDKELRGGEESLRGHCIPGRDRDDARLTKDAVRMRQD